jgi:RNA polymerase sigma-70 factor (ECF subfamily)
VTSDDHVVHGLAELIREHRAYVRASLAHFGVHGVGLDDAEQEVFLVLLRRRADFDPSSSHRRWLWGISRNVARAFRRREGRTGCGAPPPEPCSFEDRVHVEQAIAALDDHQRHVWLARVEGRTAEEIASAMRVPLTTVQWRIRTAKERLQAFVADAGRRCRALVVLVRGGLTPAGSTIAGVVLLAMTATNAPPVDELDPATPAVAPDVPESLPRPSPCAVVPTEPLARPHTQRGMVTDDVIEIVEHAEPRAPARRTRPRARRSPEGLVKPLDPHVVRLPPGGL